MVEYSREGSKSLFVYRKTDKKKKLKAGAGSKGKKGKVLAMSRREDIYDAKGNNIGTINYRTVYDKITNKKGTTWLGDVGRSGAAGPKGFGRKSKFAEIKGSKTSKLKPKKKD